MLHQSLIASTTRVPLDPVFSSIRPVVMPRGACVCPSSKSAALCFCASPSTTSVSFLFHSHVSRQDRTLSHVALVGTAMPCHLEARQAFLFLSVRGVCSVINRVSDALSFRGQQRFDRLTDVPGNTCCTWTWTWPWLRYRNRSRNVQAPQPSQQWADRETEKTRN